MPHPAKKLSIQVDPQGGGSSTGVREIRQSGFQPVWETEVAVGLLWTVLKPDLQEEQQVSTQPLTTTTLQRPAHVPHLCCD